MANQPGTCAICGAPAVRDGNTGRHRIYCSTTCRRTAENRLKPARKELDDLNKLIRRLEREKTEPHADLPYFDGAAFQTAAERLPALYARRDDLERELFS